jgi:hypothetical protein
MWFSLMQDKVKGAKGLGFDNPIGRGFGTHGQPLKVFA